MIVRPLLVCLFIVAAGGFGGASAQRPSPVGPQTAQVTPLPPALRQARSVFLINETSGPAADTAFRELQAQMRQWNRLQVVDRADRADLTMSLTTTQIERTRIAGGAPVGARLANPKTSIVRSNVSRLTVRRPSSGEILWTGEDEVVGAMIRRLQEGMSFGPAVCVVFWCW